jgi:hypothetical protein
LIGLAVIAVLAVCLHASWSSLDAGVAARTLELTKQALRPILGEPSVPQKPKRRSPRAVRVAASEAAPDIEASDSVEMPDGSEPAFEELPEGGLTSDLKLGAEANNAAAIDKSNGLEAAAATPEAAADPGLSLDELYEIADQTDTEPASGAPEPWTEQAPETAPAAPAPGASPSSTTGPATNSRTRR